jgi:hypothetical protein
MFAVLWAAVVNAVARAFGGSGAFPGVFTGLAFAQVPGIIGSLLQALRAVDPTLGAVVVLPATLAVTVWSLVLAVLAARESHRLSTGQAVGAVALGIAAMLVIGILLAIVALAFILVAAA